MALIELDKVSKVYRMGDVEVHAMREVSLSVEERDFVAVMGSSGSGKSTLMNIIGCLDRPTSGAYRLDGDEVSRLDRRARCKRVCRPRTLAESSISTIRPEDRRKAR